jgi:hypothetical protein
VTSTLQTSEPGVGEVVSGLPNRTIWSQLSVPIKMATAKTQNGGGTIASGSFSTTGRHQLLSVAASASSTAANTMMSIMVAVDGATVGTIEHFANPSGVVFPLTPQLIGLSLEEGSHSITLTAGKSTATGSGDRVEVSLVDLGDNPEFLRLRANGYGPYPSASTAFATAGGVVLLWAAASGWLASGVGALGASVQVDGTEVGQLNAYANSSATHLPFPPVQLVLPSLAPGSHELQVVPLKGTTTDQNDRCAFRVAELTPPPQILAASTPLQSVVCASQSGGGTVASGSFTTAGGTLLVRATGTAWASSASRQLNLAVGIDSRSYGQVTGYASKASFHVALVGADLVVTGLKSGSHTIALIADANTVTDANDRCTVSIIELAAQP